VTAHPLRGNVVLGIAGADHDLSPHEAIALAIDLHVAAKVALEARTTLDSIHNGLRRAAMRGAKRRLGRLFGPKRARMGRGGP
jgi:hypothetical protein